MNMSLYRVFLNFQIELADVISLYYDQTGSFVKDFVMVILNFVRLVMFYHPANVQASVKRVEVVERS